MRYDCSTETVYVLVIAVDGQWPHKDDNAWVKLYNVSQSAVVFSAFSWVGPNGVEGESLRGYEASFSVDPDTTTYDMETHIQIISDRTSSTGKKANPAKLIIPSECETTPENPGNPDNPNETSPLAVDLNDFAVTADNGSVTINWDTGTEIDNANFKVWKAYPFTEQSPQGDSTTGASYSVNDADVVPGEINCYALEDIDNDGKSTFHEIKCVVIK